jgi:hypothetical protein
MKFIKYWLPPILWAMAIFTVSSITVGSSSDFYWKDFVVKKTAHVVEYGILATLIYRALINSNVSNKKAMLYSVALAFLYGATDEFHQSFTPGRGPKFTDVLIDTLGASIFIYGIILNLSKMPLIFRKVAAKLDIIL